MQVLADTRESEVPSLWREFISIIGWDSWKKRADSLRRQGSQNQLLSWLFGKRHELEFGIVRIQNHVLLRSKFPKIAGDSLNYRAFSFACSVAKIYRNLSDMAKARFRGMLEKGLHDEYGLESVAFEIELANHLFRQGFDVVLADLEGLARYDFLARSINNGIELEVECKLITGDKGRKIHQTDLMRLLQLIRPVTEPLFQSPGGKIVQIELPSRLEPNQAIMRQVADVVRGSVTKVPSTSQSGICSVIIRSFDLANSPFFNPRKVDESSLTNFIALNFPGRTPTLTSFSNPNGDSCVVIEIHCKEPDSLVKRIYREAKEAADKQFSKHRPALIAVKLGELTSREIDELHRLGLRKELNALQAIASRLLRNSGRNHVYSINFLAKSDILSTSIGLERLEQSSQAQGKVYVFNNPSHPGFVDNRYQLFG